VTVNPDDLLIFKMRGMRTKPKKVKAVREKAKPKQQPQPEIQPRAVEQPEAAPQPEVGMQPEAAAQPELEAQPAPPPEEAAPAPEAAAPASQPAAAETPPEGIKAEEETTPEESERLYGYAPLEGRAPKAEAAKPTAAKEKAPSINPFGLVTGILFIANGILFGYFTYPQALFLASNAVSLGLPSFIATLNYDYAISIVNFALVMLTLIGGLVMVMKPKMGHLVGGFVNSAVILAVTFEYLNSSTNYLLAVNGIAFLSIVMLVYARMSSVAAIEEEEENPEEFGWPRVEAL
jgi:hypothetical protein